MPMLYYEANIFKFRGFGMFSLIFAGAFFFFALIAALIGLLKGRKYDWRFSLSKLIIVLGSAVLTIVMLVLVAPIVGGLLSDIALKYMSFGDGSFFAAIPSMREIIKAVVAMIIAPIFFLIFFGIIKAILGACLKRPLCRALMLIGKKDNANAESVETEEVGFDEEQTSKQKKKRNSEFLSKRKFDPAGAVCGALCSFLVYIIFLMPFIGFADVANTAAQPIISDYGTVSEISDALANNAGSKTVKALGGKLMFRSLTTYSVNGEKATLEDELAFIGAVGNSVADVSKEGATAQEKTASLRATTEAFNDSTIVPTFLSELFSAASDDWSNGEEFCGVACPSIGKDFDPLVKDFVGEMKDSTTSTIKEDVSTIVDICIVIAENDGFAAVKGKDGPLALFRNEKMTSGIFLELLENNRLSGMVESFTNLGISLFTDSLEVSGDYEEMYDSFINEMSTAYTDTAKNMNGKTAAVRELSTDVKDIYTSYGIEISDSVATCVAVDMLDSLSDGSAEEIKAFFAKENKAEALDNGNTLSPVYLSNSSNDERDIFTTITNIKKSADKNTALEDLEAIVKAELETVLDGVSDEELDALSKEVAAKMHEDIFEDNIKLDKLVFANAEEMHTTSVRLAAVDLELSGTTVTNKENESKMLAHAFSVALQMVDKISDDGDDIEKSISEIGVVLDAFSACETVGEKKSALLLKAILQSDKVSSQVGFTTVQATDIADSITEGVGGDENYTTMLKSVGHTVSIIKASGNEEDTTESINELIRDITPASSKVLQNLSTPETVKNYGVKEESAKPVSGMISNMFDNMSTAKQEGMKEDEYEKESVAVNDMLTLAMTASESDKPTAFGSEGAMGITVTEFVDRATDSKIMSKTFVETVYEDGENVKSNPLNSNMNLTADEKAELQSSLDAKWQAQLASSNDEAANEEYKKTLTSIAVMVNADITFTNSGVVIA